MSPMLTARFAVPRSGFEVSIDLELDRGQALALMGPSGAGKSTIVHALAGIEQISGGQITLDGQRLAAPGVHLPPHRRGIGLLGQDPRLFPHLDAASNIAFGARAGGKDKRQARQVAQGWLERLDFQALAGQRPAALSGGQRQRIALARALAAGPKMLLVDEPFASLDVEAAADMRELLRTELQRTGMTSIVISHSAADAIALAGQLAVIEHGVVVQRGPVAEVLSAPATRFVRAVAATVPAKGVFGTAGEPG
ncbi:ABC transporter ATP-binding protein [Glutamicibacter creatinolyticus]|uniref:ABC transporter ATP-binding protein n=1 Tax=Glutamicibacter creatinolyticus TaxID=162496 RepID=UPI0037BF8B8F